MRHFQPAFLAEIDTSTIVLMVLGLIVFVFFIILMKYINLYIRALFSKASISLLELIGMSLRKVNPKLIVDARIRVVQAGVSISRAQLEAHYLAG